MSSSIARGPSPSLEGLDNSVGSDGGGNACRAGDARFLPMRAGDGAGAAPSMTFLSPTERLANEFQRSQRLEGSYPHAARIAGIRGLSRVGLDEGSYTPDLLEDLQLRRELARVRRRHEEFITSRTKPRINCSLAYRGITPASQPDTRTHMIAYDSTNSSRAHFPHQP